MHVSSPFRPIEPNQNSIDANSPRSRSSSGFSESSSRANSVIGLPIELSVDELRKYTNTKLLSAYNDAIQRQTDLSSTQSIQNFNDVATVIIRY